MKKQYLFIAILGLILGYFAKFDFWFSEGRDIFFPNSVQPLSEKKTAPISPDNDPTSATSNTNSGAFNHKPFDIEKLSQSELFHALYNKNILAVKTHQFIYFNKIKDRLKSPYPDSPESEHRTQYEKEVAHRMGLLRAMRHYWPTPKQVSVNHHDIKAFFWQVAANPRENIMVRREAYKNWLGFGNTTTQKDKMNLLATSNTKLLHLISVSDDTLIEQLSESAP